MKQLLILISALIFSSSVYGMGAIAVDDSGGGGASDIGYGVSNDMSTKDEAIASALKEGSLWKLSSFTMEIK